MQQSWIEWNFKEIKFKKRNSFTFNLSQTNIFYRASIKVHEPSTIPLYASIFIQRHTESFICQILYKTNKRKWVACMEFFSPRGIASMEKTPKHMESDVLEWLISFSMWPVDLYVSSPLIIFLICALLLMSLPISQFLLRLTNESTGVEETSREFTRL